MKNVLTANRKTACDSRLLDSTRVCLVVVALHLKQMIDLDQRHYPESMYKMFIINSPWLLSTAFEVVKPWLDPMTLSKTKSWERITKKYS